MIKEWLEENHFVKGKIIVQYVVIALAIGCIIGIMIARPIIQKESSLRMAPVATWSR